MESSTAPSYKLSHPVLLVTSVLAVLGWIIAFIGGCVGALHGVGWWIIIFQLVLIVCAMVTLGRNAFAHHRTMILAFLIIGIVYLTMLIEQGLNLTGNAFRAVVGGSVILIIMEFIWLFLFSAQDGGIVSNIGQSMSGGGGGSGLTLPKFQNRFTSNQGVHPQSKESDLPPSPTAIGADIGKTEKGAEVGSKVAARHAYTANPDDPNELSFQANEDIEILDKSGNWWRARKEDGSEGIVPSNYF